MRRELERIEIPGEHDARLRTWAVVRAAYAEREPVPRRRPLLVPALAAAAVLAVVAAAASPPGRAVIDDVREVIGIEGAAPAVFSLPPGGAGAAHVRERRVDRARRRLETLPRPRPRRRLVAVRPLCRRRARERARRARAGRRHALDARAAGRVQSGLGRVRDGHADRVPLRRPAAGRRRRRHRRPAARARHRGRAAGLAPGRRARPDVRDARRRDRHGRHRLGPRALAAARGGSGRARLEWSSDGRRLLVQGGDFADVLTRDGRPFTGFVAEEGRILAAAFRPGSHAVAYAHEIRGRTQALVDGEPGGLVFSGPGRIDELAWSPDGRWLLLGWRAADQWLFVRPGARSVDAASDISGQFRSADVPDRSRAGAAPPRRSRRAGRPARPGSGRARARGTVYGGTRDPAVPDGPAGGPLPCARRRLHPRRRVRRDGRHAAPAAHRCTGGRPRPRRPEPQPGRVRARHAAERARRRPEPELRVGVAPARTALEPAARGAASVVGAGDAPRPDAGRAAAARRHDLVPPAAGARARVGPERRRGARVRAARGDAVPVAAAGRTGPGRTGRTTASPATPPSSWSCRPGGCRLRRSNGTSRRSSASAARSHGRLGRCSHQAIPAPT